MQRFLMRLVAGRRGAGGRGPARAGWRVRPGIEALDGRLVPSPMRLLPPTLPPTREVRVIAAPLSRIDVRVAAFVFPAGAAAS